MPRLKPGDVDHAAEPDQSSQGIDNTDGGQREQGTPRGWDAPGVADHPSAQLWTRSTSRTLVELMSSTVTGRVEVIGSAEAGPGKRSFPTLGRRCDDVADPGRKS